MVASAGVRTARATLRHKPKVQRRSNRARDDDTDSPEDLADLELKAAQNKSANAALELAIDKFAAGSMSAIELAVMSWHLCHAGLECFRSYMHDPSDPHLEKMPRERFALHSAWTTSRRT